MPEIKTVSVRHNEIMDYLMANPTRRLGDVAAHFGLTPAWLSCVIHSDAFQNLLKEKQDIAFHHTILPLREKIEHTAHRALDRLADMIEMETETTTLNKVANDSLERLGFGSKPHGGGINVFNGPVQINGELRSELEEARALIGAKSSAAPKALEVMVDGQRAPIGISSAHLSGVGKDLREAELSGEES